MHKTFQPPLRTGDPQSAGTFTNCFLDRKSLEAQNKNGQIGSYDMLTTWSLSVKQKAFWYFSLCRGPNLYYQWFTSPLHPNQLKYCGIPELWSLCHLADRVIIKNQWITKFDFQIPHCWRLASSPLSVFVFLWLGEKLLLRTTGRPQTTHTAQFELTKILLPQPSLLLGWQAWAATAGQF